MNKRKFAVAMIFLGLFVGTPQIAGKLLAVQEKESLPDPNYFSARSYKNNKDRPKGFAIAMKLINRAEKEKASPALIAKLRCQAASIKRMMVLNERDENEKNFAVPIRILRGVTHHPDRFLVDKDSAAWYRNCVGLLTAVYGDQGDSSDLIAEELKITMQFVAESKNLNDEEKFRTTCDIRMAGSDAALGIEDWAAAIKWVQPIIDSADRFLDNDGAYRIAMATRQQSMFLKKNGQPEESSNLIDSMCEKLDGAKAVDEYLRLSMLCMLRGKHLINFDNAVPGESEDPLVIAGWEKYEKLSKRVVAYQGKERDKLLRSYTNMRRLANWRVTDADKSIENLRHVMEVIKDEPLLHNSNTSVWFNLGDMHRGTEQILKKNQDPRLEEIKTEVQEFVKKYRK